MRGKLAMIAATMCVGIYVPQLHATLITVPNGNFETDTRTNTNAQGQINGASTSWVQGSGTGLVGVLNLTQASSAATYSGKTGIAANGNYEGFTQGSGTIYSNTMGGLLYQPNTTYVASVQLGHSYENPGGTYTFNLVDGTTDAVLGTVTGNYPADGNAALITVSTAPFTTGLLSGVLGTGDPIRIDYVAGANGTQAFDNVTLDASPVPEPASLSLLGLAAAGLVTRRRRRA